MPSTPPDPETTNPPLEAAMAAIRRLLDVLYRLRAPDGCPWDRVQTVRSMAPYLLEESYEAVDAILSNRRADMSEELGDVLMNVLMIPLAGEAEGTLTIADVADGIAHKLIRRHPHVFGNKEVAGVEDVWKNWEAIKAAEKREKAEDDSAIAGVPVALPSLLRALRIVEKAKRAGFRYADLAGPITKIEEEWRELKVEIEANDSRRIEEELGDLLFAITVLASHLSVNPEVALRSNIATFASRFRHVERALGPAMRDATLVSLQAAWNAAKEATANVSNTSVGER
ncbi:MAG: nucleoside triphosphate pyrophosphohydrolase [Planctomycetota bacterium]